MEWLPRVGVEERIVVVVVVVENGERRVYSDSWLFLFPSFHIPILWLFFSRSSHNTLVLFLKCI